MRRGLFIGIDQYRAPVTRLSCARRDAEALAALFADTMGGAATLDLPQPFKTSPGPIPNHDEGGCHTPLRYS